MPTYEYACKSCGEHLEIVQSFKDDPLTTCPSCGGVLRKVFGAVGIAFKGSGFYKTDSRPSPKSDTSSSSSSSKSSGGDSKASTSDAKSDSSTASKPADKPSSGSTPAKTSESKSAAS